MNPWTIDDPAAVERIRDIVIVGGGTAGWMTAAILARSLPSASYAIRLVEPAAAAPGLDALDGGEACLPPIHLAHGLLGIGPEALLRGADATFSLGAEFAGFGDAGSRYFHPFGAIGVGMEGVAFHNQWERLRREGDGRELADYSLAAVAARLGRFAPPSDDPRSVLSSHDYAWHWDGAAYRGLLRAAAAQAGVERIEGEVAGVALRGGDGFIEAVLLDGDRRIEGDLFVDCTGAEGRLIEGALGTGFEDWSRWLACDGAIAVRAASAGDPPPYRSVEAEAAGWRWRIPLRTTTGFGHVYASAVTGDDEAEARLLASLDGAAVGAPRRVRFASGRRSRMWNRNCVAIGASACVLDPVEPTAVQIVIEGVRIFLNLMPDKSFAAGEADEYNRLMIETVERMRDYLILHYKATRRDDSPFWTQAAAMEVPDLLAHKMRLFESRGMIQLLDEETFLEPDWAALYFGQGAPPRAYDPLADIPDSGLVRERLRTMREAIRAAAEAMPGHRRFIEAGLAAAAGAGR